MLIERTAKEIQNLVDTELSRIKDENVLKSLYSLLVEPKSHQRNWDYGKNGEVYTCWMVAEHPLSQTGFAYCDYGFGPRSPWGLVWLNDEWFGMDSGWFATLEDAFRDSMAFEDAD